MIIRECGDKLTMFVKVEESDYAIDGGRPAKKFIARLERTIPDKLRHSSEGGYLFSVGYMRMIRQLKDKFFPVDRTQTVLF